MSEPMTDGGLRTGGPVLAARLLRGLGAVVLVASLSVFLFQGWSGAGDLGRYGLLLAQTVLLMATGFASARWLGEPKGARVFVGVALVAVVASFAVLGGLVWSQFQWLGAPGSFPESLVWQAVSGAWALGAAAGSVPLLAPVSRIGFTILARHSARPLTGLFLGSCALLLVPVRDPWTVGVLGALVGAGLAAFARRGLARDPGLRTPEGGFALVLPLLPVGVALGRGVLFYPGADLLLAVATLVAFAALREAARCTEPGGRWGTALDRAGATAAIAAGLAWAELLVPAALGHDALLPVFGLVAGGLTAELSRRAHRSGKAYRLLAAALASASVAANGLIMDTLVAAVTALAVGIAVAALAVAERRPWILAAALVAGLAGLGDLVVLAVGSVELGAWGWLALIGTAAVLGGSALERGLVRRLAAGWREGSAPGAE